MTSPPRESTANYPSLIDRVVLVTGGGSGIGAAVVRAFAQKRSRVAFLDVVDEASEKLVAHLAGEGRPRPRYLHCDLRDIAALRSAITEVERTLGPIDVLVNNAANDDRHEFDVVEPAYFDDRIAINLRHYFFAIQAVRGAMARNGGGSIVNLGSIAWRLKLPGIPVYATAKAAIEGMTKALACELGPQRIRINCIEPGYVATERQKKLWLTPEFEAKVRAGQCLPDIIEPGSIADMVLFLASDQGRMCTRQTFVVDGGWT